MVAVLVHDAHHRVTVFGEARERSAAVAGDERRLMVGAARHQGGDGPGVGPARVAVVGQAGGHQQGAEVCIAQAQGPELVRALLDLGRRVGGEADDDLLSRDHDPDRMLERGGVESARTFLPELHQVQRGEVAGSAIQEEEFAAWIRCVDAVRIRAGVPVVRGRVILHAGVATDPGPLGDAVQQVLRPEGLGGLAGRAELGVPGGVVLDGLHEVVGDADAVVGVLEGDGVVGAADDVEGARVAGVNEGMGLQLGVLLAVNELFDVRVINVQNAHAGRAARAAAALDAARRSVQPLHEGDRAAGPAARFQRLLGGAQGGQVQARAAAVLEEHPLGLVEVQDALHGVINFIDVTR